MLDKVRAFSAFVTMDPKGNQMNDARGRAEACLLPHTIAVQVYYAVIVGSYLCVIRILCARRVKLIDVLHDTMESLLLRWNSSTCSGHHLGLVAKEN